MNKQKRRIEDAEPGTEDKFSRHLSSVICIAFFIALPFFVLYWMVPFAGKYTIGNDYLNYWINNQMFLRYSLSSGTFPLYAPGFNGGWTASALTLGGLYHPLSWLAAAVPGYWNGYAFQIGTIIRLIELGMTGLVLYLFLRRLRLLVLPAFVLSFITVYNLRMLDMFRYGAALENYAAMLLLCTAIGWFYLSPASRFSPFCIAISSWLLVVGGHPQIMFIGFLGAAFVFVIFPFYAGCLLPDEQKPQLRRVLRFWGISAVSILLGILLASPYILPFYFEYMQESNRGVGLDFAYACSQQDNFAGILCNFFNPFFSGVPGAFGGSALILLAVSLPVTAIFCIRRAWPVLIIWAVCIVVLILSAGSNGPLYYYFWKYVPFTQAFRVPGRLCMVLPFAFMLILCWMFRQQPVQIRAGRRISFAPILPASITAFILFMALRGLDYEGSISPERYVIATINEISSDVLTLFFICGLITLLAVIIYVVSVKLRGAAGVILTVSVIAGSMFVLRYGTWIAPGERKTKTFAQMQAEQKQRLCYRYPTGDLSRTLIVEHLKRTFLEPVLARFCPRFEVVGSQAESYQRLSELREIDLAYVEGTPAPKADRGDKEGVDSIELKYNSFNNFIFDANCARQGYFVFSQPYSPFWQARIDGVVAPIYRCNAIEQGVWVLPGEHRVEFRYRSPATAAGFVTGCIAFIVIWGLLFYGRARLIALPAAVVLSVVLLALWRYSLYQGGNIGTQYLWTSRQVGPNLSSRYNLAYGRKTTMSEAGVESYFTDSTLGVDGDRDGYFGFVTNVKERTWWQVDLDSVRPISEIVIYKMRGGLSRSGIPFDVMFSRDGVNWSVIDTVAADNTENRWHIRAPGIKTRFLRLQTRRVGRLAMAEIEIYAKNN